MSSENKAKDGSSRIGRVINPVLLLLAGLGVLIFIFLRLTLAVLVEDGRSMLPTIQNGEYVFVNRLYNIWGPLQRGDLIWFNAPPPDENVTIVKRLIGIPGDTVEFRNRQLFINGELIEEPYILEPCNSRCPDNIWVLGSDEYFVMGDNRNNSSDSRRFGPIHSNIILGRVIR